MRFEEHKSLKSFNTFGLEAFAKYFIEINNVKDLELLFKDPIYSANQKLILGGGSNILFTKDFNGLVIKNNIKGIEILNKKEHIIKAGAGENWHEFVMFCIDKGLGGVENLSLIPGCVGASPMQNIGAYGVEIKDVFYELSAFDLTSGEIKTFSKQECDFAYRESVFKRKYKDRYLVVDVSFKLSKDPKLSTHYGAINDELKKMGIEKPKIKDVSNAVIAIRQSKLPDPKEIGNAGSFFKNPEVSTEKYQSLKKEFDALVAYPLENGHYKLAAGWLIEQSGLKGFEMNGAAVHNKQALVLVNKNNTTGQNIYQLSDYVLSKVFDKFGVQLEREVNII
ncbi:MAG: UDP-N-acetylmuramate dehydrogenase [Bacteroidota bacterium]|nr:UDP-N-acetylmuramate dehydrogenase [Bacteroidota bacterium]